MMNMDGITQNDEDTFDCTVINGAVYKGLGNKSQKAMAESAAEHALDSVEIFTYNTEINLYTAEGYPIYSLPNSDVYTSEALYYEDSNGQRHYVGTCVRIPEKYRYHLFPGEYHISVFKTTSGDSNIKIYYNLNETWSVSDPAITLSNPKKNDRIFISRWQPGMTSEDGILIQRG